MLAKYRQAPAKIVGFAKYITPAIVQSGWDVHAQIREQVYITDGPVIVRGRVATRGKRKFADYLDRFIPPEERA